MVEVEGGDGGGVEGFGGLGEGDRIGAGRAEDVVAEEGAPEVEREEESGEGKGEDEEEPAEHKGDDNKGRVKWVAPGAAKDDGVMNGWAVPVLRSGSVRGVTVRRGLLATGRVNCLEGVGADGVT